MHLPFNFVRAQRLPLVLTLACFFCAKLFTWLSPALDDKKGKRRTFCVNYISANIHTHTRARTLTANGIRLVDVNHVGTTPSATLAGAAAGSCCSHRNTTSTGRRRRRIAFRPAGGGCRWCSGGGGGSDDSG